MRFSIFLKYFKHKLFFLLLIGILLRVTIIPLYFNSDVLAQAEWAKWLQEHGTKGFYDRNAGFIERPNYPPFISIWYLIVPFIQGNISLFFTNIGLFIALNKLGASHILWYYDFVKWFGSDTFEQTGLRYGFLALIKFLPIAADLLIGGLVYLFAKQVNPRQALFYCGLYLFFPFSFYVSSYWGQTDPVSALLLFLGVFMLYKKRFIISSVLLTLSLNIKLTGLLITPLFIFYYLYLKPSLKTIVTSILISIILYLFSVSLFTNSNPIFYAQKLHHIFLFIKQPYLNVSAFNFWFIFSGSSRISDLITYFLFPSRYWGFLIMIGLNLVGFSIIRQKTMSSVLKAIFIVGFGSWLFLTNMYERYLFNGILALFFISIVDKKYLKYFLILGSISLLNMLQGPLAPPQISNVLDLDNKVVSKLLALLNIVIFFRILYLMNIIRLPKSIKNKCSD